MSQGQLNIEAIVGNTLEGAKVFEDFMEAAYNDADVQSHVVNDQEKIFKADLGIKVTPSLKF